MQAEDVREIDLTYSPISHTALTHTATNLMRNRLVLRHTVPIAAITDNQVK